MKKITYILFLTFLFSSCRGGSFAFYIKGLTKALTFREEKTYIADSKKEFVQLINEGGFVYAHWDGTAETEKVIKQETKATIRCIPLNEKKEIGICLFSGKSSDQRVLFAKAY